MSKSDWWTFSPFIVLLCALAVTGVSELAAHIDPASVDWLTVSVVSVVGALAYSTIAGVCYGWLARKLDTTPPSECDRTYSYDHVQGYCNKCRRMLHYKKRFGRALAKALAWPLWPLLLPRTLFRAGASLSTHKEIEECKLLTQ